MQHTVQTFDKYCLENNFLYVPVSKIQKNFHDGILTFQCGPTELEVKIPLEAHAEIMKLSEKPFLVDYLVLSFHDELRFDPGVLAWTALKKLAAYSWVRIGNHRATPQTLLPIIALNL